MVNNERVGHARGGGGEEEQNASSFLKPLKTLEEIRARDTLIDVYVTRIPAKTSSKVLDVLKSKNPENGFDFQHMRRFAKLGDIPSHLGLHSEDANDDSTTASLYLILGTTGEFTADGLHDIVKITAGSTEEIRIIQVPMLPPASQEQAISWSKKYWPTVYKKSNPYGPHPSIVSRAEQEIAPDAQEYMTLARRAGQEADGQQIGEPLGAVIVFRENNKSHAVCVAGDARWKDIEVRTGGRGNVTAHAVMRAIGMVAQKLKAAESSSKESSKSNTPPSQGITQNEIFLDLPLTALESSMYSEHEIAANGYLCHNLEIYITHEPCVMCSMAILHSRFAKVVFGHRMPKTGGMCADSKLGLGLSWRKELNWSLLSWEISGESDSNPIINQETHV